MGPLEEKEELSKLGNEGYEYNPNRATRRKAPPNDPWYTKATHKFKKIRRKNAKARQRDQRKLARARKARQEDSTQIS